MKRQGTANREIKVAAENLVAGNRVKWDYAFDDDDLLALIENALIRLDDRRMLDALKIFAGRQSVHTSQTMQQKMGSITMDGPVDFVALWGTIYNSY